jgi:hypothetical protein
VIDIEEIINNTILLTSIVTADVKVSSDRTIRTNIDIVFNLKFVVLPAQIQKKLVYLVDIISVILLAFLSISLLTILWSNTVQAQVINILDKGHIWRPVNHARIFYSRDGMLNIITDTYNPDKEFNRGSLQTIISPTKKPLLLYMQYASRSFEGKASFVAEIRDSNNSAVLWNTFLNNTGGGLTDESFILPNNITGKQIQFRLYTITEGPGMHDLSVKNATIEMTSTASIIDPSSSIYRNN